MNFRNTMFQNVAATIDQCPPPDRPEIVFAGKSNVGKSSLINALCDNRKLARISSSPGKTRQVIYFSVDKKIYFTDLPGYGYAKASKLEQRRFSALVDAYFDLARPIALVLFLLDCRHLPSKEDHLMHQFLKASGLPYALVLAKTDKLSRQDISRHIRDICHDLNLDRDLPVYPVSAEKKTGIQELQGLIENVVTPLLPSFSSDV